MNFLSLKTVFTDCPKGQTRDKKHLVSKLTLLRAWYCGSQNDYDCINWYFEVSGRVIAVIIFPASFVDHFNVYPRSGSAHL